MQKTLNDIKNKTIDILLDLGITPEIKGFKHIIFAVQEIRLGTDEICKVYENVARKTNATKTAVERNIRHAIAKMDKSKWFYPHVEKFTNGYVLHSIALKIEQGEYWNE